MNNREKYMDWITECTDELVQLGENDGELDFIGIVGAVDFMKSALTQTIIDYQKRHKGD